MRNPCVPKRAVWLRRACQEPGRPRAEGTVLTCSPGLSAVENHWDTGWPLPNSSVWDVSGLIFAPLPFSRKKTQGSGEFALLSFPLAFSPLDKWLLFQEPVSPQRGGRERRDSPAHAVLCPKELRWLRLNRR